MDKDKKVHVTSNSGGIFWIIGWIFSIGLFHLSFWNAVLGIIIWPYYIGDFLFRLHQAV